MTNNIIIEIPFKGVAYTSTRKDGTLSYTSCNNLNEYKQTKPELQLVEVDQDEFNKMQHDYYNGNQIDIAKAQYFDILEQMTRTAEIPNVQIWHVPTDTDLAKGQKVATKDVWGEFTETGIIERIYEDWGVMVYEIDHTAYVANELRLLKN